MKMEVSSQRDDIFVTPDKAVRPQSGVRLCRAQLPRHAGRKIVPVGKYAAEERGGWHKSNL